MTRIAPPSPPYVGPAAHTSAGSNQPIYRVVIHCTVSPCVKGGARATAAYFREAASGGSAHYVVDPGEAVQVVYDDTIAWHAPPNQHSIGVELCDAMVDAKGNELPASRWSDADHKAMLKHAAHLVARLCLAYDVPIAKLTSGQLLAGKHGICGHADVSQAWHQSDHWDPGTHFPWDVFISRVQAAADKILNQPAPTPPPPPAPTPTPPPAPKPKRKRHLLRLESAPLHTERHVWASHAPAQATASYQRGAHVIGFTEVTKAVAPQLEALAGDYGYTFIHGGGDTALAIQSHLKTVRVDPFVRVAGERGYTSVTFRFHGNKVTVINQHWGTNHPEHHATRVAQTQALIQEMHHAANGRKLAFYMGDTNPSGQLSSPGTFPRADLDAAGFPLIYEALNKWPANIGVNAIGHARWDKRVQAKAVDTFDALGSDHIPALGVYVVTGRPPLLRRLLGR